jgi:HD-GYP domain-containing protein (c-di-GMP phosphodiesterase class II)
MHLADLLIRSDEDFVSARRKIHESTVVLSGDPQLAAVVAGDFSDLMRALTSVAKRVLVHVALIRKGAGRALQLDCTITHQPPAQLAFSHKDGDGWHFVRTHAVSAGWVDERLIEQVRTIVEQKSREELLSENNELLRKTLATRTESLNRLAVEFGSIQDLDTLLARVLAEARGVFRCEAGSILMHEEGMLRFRHSSNDGTSHGERILTSTANPVRLPIDRNSMAGAAALDGIVMVRDAYNLDPGVPFKFNKAIDLATGFRTRAVLSIGMRSSQRELLGVLQLINPRSEEDEALEFTSEDQKLAVHFGGMASLAIERSSMTRALVLRMMRLAELRDPKETGAHVKRVAEVAVRLFVAWAQKRGMSEESIFKQLDHLRPAAMLHDVGKVGIEDAILKKPGKLEPEERARMERHSRIGAETLLGVKTAMDETIREVTLYHHARWDGAGYPKLEEIVQTLQQLGVDATDVPEPRGDGIPLPARLVAIADVFDALMSRRAYKDAWTPDQVREEMVRSKGTHFDPELVDLFLADFEEYCLIHSTIRE